MRGENGKLLGGVFNVVSYALILLPVVAAFVYVYVFGVDMPFGDVWTMVPRFEKLLSGTLGFSDLWVQHFEHRIFFPRIAILLLGVVTDFNQIAIMYLTEVCFVGTLVILLLAFRANIGTRLLFFVPISFLVFNLGQYFNMFYGLQVSFAFTQVFSVLALYLIYVSTRGRLKKWIFAAAPVSAVVATFSLFGGLFIWPVGFLQLLISPAEKRTKINLLTAWSAAGLVAVAAYFFGWSIPERQVASYTFDAPVLLVRYFLTALGSPLTWWWRPDLAFVVGLLLAVLLVIALFVLYRTRRIGEFSFWISLIAFALVFLAFLTLGRSGVGLQSALQSRYVTFTGLGLIGIYAILLKLASERVSRVATASFVVFLVAIVLSVPFSYSQGIAEGEQVQKIEQREVRILSKYGLRPDRFLKLANRGPGIVERDSFVMCKLGYSLFSDQKLREQNCLPPPFSSVSGIPTPTLYEVDTIGGKAVNQQEQPITIPADQPSIGITGWAIDFRNERAAGGVYIKIDDERFPAFYGRGKGRVAARFGNPAYRFSGFEQTIPASKIGPGKHELSIIVLTSNRERYYEPPEQKIVFEIVEDGSTGGNGTSGSDG